MAMGRLALLVSCLHNYARAARGHSVWNRAYATYKWHILMKMTTCMTVVSSTQYEGGGTALPTCRSYGPSPSSSM